MNGKNAMAIEEKFSRLKERLRQPGTQLLLALALSVAILAALAANTIYPVLREEAAVRLNHAGLKRQLDELNRQPLPERVDLAAVRELAARVPLTKELPEFMRALQKLGEDSGVLILNFSHSGEARTEKDLITEYLEQNRRGSSQDRETAASGPEELAQKATPIRLSLTVQGTYEQALAMLGGIQSLERIAVVESWNLNPVTDEDANDADATGEEQVRLSMNVVIYEAAGYKNIFSEAAQTEVPAAEFRERNPVIGDLQYLEMLRQSLRDE